MMTYRVHNEDEDDTCIVREDGSGEFWGEYSKRDKWKADHIAATLNWREIWEAKGGDVMELLQQHQEHTQ